MMCECRGSLVSFYCVAFMSLHMSCVLTGREVVLCCVPEEFAHDVRLLLLSTDTCKHIPVSSILDP